MSLICIFKTVLANIFNIILVVSVKVAIFLFVFLYFLYVFCGEFQYFVVISVYNLCCHSFKILF